MDSSIYAAPWDVRSLNMFARPINNMITQAQAFATEPFGPSEVRVSSWDNGYGYWRTYPDNSWHWYTFNNYGSSRRSSNDVDSNRKIIGLILCIASAVTAVFLMQELFRWSDTKQELRQVQGLQEYLEQCKEDPNQDARMGLVKRICTTHQRILWRRKFSCEMGAIIKVVLTVSLAATGYGMMSNRAILVANSARILAASATMSVVKFVYDQWEPGVRQDAAQMRQDISDLRGNILENIAVRFGIISTS